MDLLKLGPSLTPSPQVLSSLTILCQVTHWAMSNHCPSLSSPCTLSVCYFLVLVFLYCLVFVPSEHHPIMLVPLPHLVSVTLKSYITGFWSVSNPVQLSHLMSRLLVPSFKSVRIIWNTKRLTLWSPTKFSARVNGELLITILERNYSQGPSDFSNSNSHNRKQVPLGRRGPLLCQSPTARKSTYLMLLWIQIGGRIWTC